MPQLIPVTEYGNRKISVSPDGNIAYWFRTYYSQGEEDTWFLDISDAQGNELVNGLPIVPGAPNILKGYGDKFPEGIQLAVAVIAGDESDTNALGNGTQLVWFNADEENPYVVGDPLIDIPADEWAFKDMSTSNDHNTLSNRFIPNQHDIDAIQGLRTALNSKAGALEVANKVSEAPIDGNLYGRQNGSWRNMDSAGLPAGGNLGDLIINTAPGEGIWVNANVVAANIPPATAASNGLMSKEDKVKLDGIGVVGTVNSVSMNNELPITADAQGNADLPAAVFPQVRLSATPITDIKISEATPLLRFTQESPTLIGIANATFDRVIMEINGGDITLDGQTLYDGSSQTWAQIFDTIPGMSWDVGDLALSFDPDAVYQSGANLALVPANFNRINNIAAATGILSADGAIYIETGFANRYTISGADATFVKKAYTHESGAESTMLKDVSWQRGANGTVAMNGLYRDLSGEIQTDIVREITVPVANSVNDGIMPKETVATVEELITKVEALSGSIVPRGSITEPTADVTPAILTQYIQDNYSRTPQIGDAVLDGDNVQWVYTDTGWVKWSSSSVAQATNDDGTIVGTLGIVKGKNQLGRVLVETDGSMSLVGYDTMNNTLSNHVANHSNPHQTSLEQLGGISANDINSALALKANLASPAFTGNPTVPVREVGNNSTSIASTSFVNTALNNKITYSTTDLVAGSSSLGTGIVYLVYE